MAARWPHRVTVKSYTTSTDSYGTQTSTYTITFERWAHVRPIGGSERYEAERHVGLMSHTVEMVYDPDDPVRVKDHIVFGNLTLDINYIENVGERDRRIICHCSSVAESS